MKKDYYKTIMMIEKLHRLFLEVIRNRLRKLNIKDINNIQCCILYNIGKSELSVGMLTEKGYYHGSNVSYNLRKMVENRYLFQRPSETDRRISEVRLTDKGLDLHQKIDDIFTNHADILSKNNVDEDAMKSFNKTLNFLEEFLRSENMDQF